MKYVSYYRANIYVIKNPINGYQSISDNTDFIFIIIIRLNIDVFLHTKKKIIQVTKISLLLSSESIFKKRKKNKNSNLIWILSAFHLNFYYSKNLNYIWYCYGTKFRVFSSTYHG